MIWLVAIPLLYSGFFLHSATAKTEDCGLVHTGMRAAGLTMVAAGALAVLS